MGRRDFRRALILLAGLLSGSVSAIALHGTARAAAVEHVPAR